jgi:hypothetical protein
MSGGGVVWGGGAAVGVLAFDGWLHLDDGFAWGPSFDAWLTANKEKVEEVFFFPTPLCDEN